MVLFILGEDVILILWIVHKLLPKSYVWKLFQNGFTGNGVENKLWCRWLWRPAENTEMQYECKWHWLWWFTENTEVQYECEWIFQQCGKLMSLMVILDFSVLWLFYTLVEPIALKKFHYHSSSFLGYIICNPGWASHCVLVIKKAKPGIQVQ